MSTELRKVDHIRIVLDSHVEHKGTTWLEYIHLPHRAVPELNVDEVDLSLRFLGKWLKAPIMVTGMTGGHPATREVNCSIAEAVEELGLAMGVGSQRAAVENPSPEIIESYSVVRKCAPSAPIVGNIGLAQLVEGYGIDVIEKLVEMIEADAIAVHLNIGQEVVQPEGDKMFKGFIDRLEELVDKLSVPVIVKETGHGIGYETAILILSRGVRYIDVSGAGGTSWIRVESYRARIKGLSVEAKIAEDLGDWGIPTAQAIVETRWAGPHACVIASGGIRTALDAIKALVLGADVVGTALPVLKAYASGGSKAVKEYLKYLVNGVKAAAVMLGAKKLSDLHSNVEPSILEPLRSVLEARGVKLKLYMRVRRQVSHRC